MFSIQINLILKLLWHLLICFIFQSERILLKYLKLNIKKLSYGIPFPLSSPSPLKSCSFFKNQCIHLQTSGIKILSVR